MKLTKEQRKMINDIKNSPYMSRIEVGHYDKVSVELRDLGLVEFNVHSHGREVRLTREGEKL